MYDPVVVQSFFERGFHPVFWRQEGDRKGPVTPEWPKKTYTIDDYHPGDRVGLKTGVAITAGRHLCAIDNDWAPGSIILQKLFPDTNFVFGRSSKEISYCVYTLPEAIPSLALKNPFKLEGEHSDFIELFSANADGSIGHQIMVPPSEWTKDGKREELVFRRNGDPYHEVNIDRFKQLFYLTGIGMLIAYVLKERRFDHHARMAWAGYLLRAEVAKDDLITMGEGIAIVTGNDRTRNDVRLVVESTIKTLKDPRAKVFGAPEFSKILGERGKVVIELINEWLGRDVDFIRDRKGIPLRDNQDNIMHAIDLVEVRLTKDDFRDYVEIEEPAKSIRVLDDDTVADLQLRIEKEYKLKTSDAYFLKVVKHYARKHSYHPVREYFNDCPRWDQKSRNETWLIDYGGAEDTPYCRAVAKIFLIACVRRIKHPGCKYDEMLILESKQGMNKSSAIKALCPREEWFSDNFPLNADAKLIIEQTSGKWIIESGDLVGKRKADVDHIKNMLSKSTDGPVRLAYGHIPIERLRQWVLIGTTNSNEYLKDTTGARRFWPVKILKFDVDAIIRDRDQIWAEAIEREAAGESIRLDQNLWSVAEAEQETRREIDAWEEVIRDHIIELLLVGPSGRRQVSAERIWAVIQPDAFKRDALSGRRISEIMQRFGFIRWRIKENGKTVIGYISDKIGLPLDE